MMRGILALVLVWLAACGGQNVGARAAALRVMTYNIHAGKDAAQIDNLERVAALIDSVDADIVLLQEVDRRTQRSSGVDHFNELRRLTNMHGAFGKSLDYQGGEYGIAVLSRFPVDSIAAVSLKVEPPQARSGNSYEPRIALHVRVRAAAGPVHVINTHLDPGAPGTYRRQELIAALAHMKQHVADGMPLLFGGDLNARPNTDDIQAVSFALTDAFAVCGDGAGHTFPAHAPDRRIDYIFYRGARCRAARVLDTQASDHRPMLATIEISGDK
jgi:endonuclease/exonuclease/phosphatase family metal-dependent hydrolase